MNSELKDILERMNEFKKKLTDELKGNEELIGLEEELKTLEEEFKKGKLSVTANARHNRIGKRIQKINKLLEKIGKVEELEEAKKLLEELSSKKVNERAKDIQKIADAVKRDEQPDKSKLAKILDIEEKDLDIEKAKDELEKDLEKLNADLETLKKHGRVVIDLEFKIERIRVKLEEIEDYLNHNIDEKTIKSELNEFAKKTTSKEDKEKIANKYNKLINDLEAELLNELETKRLTHINIAKNKKSIKERFGAWWDKHDKLVIGLIGTTVLLAAIVSSCRNNENTNTNKKPNNDSKKPTNSSSENTYNIELRNTLISLGYNEYYATKYAAINGFDINSLEVYELTQEKYQITMETAVDYVNRAKEIQKTGFYTDATIIDIVNVIAAIDNKVLFTIENIELMQSINAPLTEIYNSYQYGTLTENDKIKLDSLLYFSSNNSNLDKFLTEYTFIVKQILNSKDDAETSKKAKDDMYNFLNTFANSYAGYLPEGEIENPVQNAIVKDTFDWNIAYTSFVRPLMSMYITPENAEKFGCLQITMLSTYEQWAKDNNCNATLTLGGNE